MNKEKKLQFLISVCLISLCLAACGKQSAMLPMTGAAPTPTPTASDSPAPAVTLEPPNTPVPAPTPVATPIPMPTPTSTPTPAPTLDLASDPSYYINISTSKSIKVTKEPGGETVNAGGSAIFTAKADGSETKEWRFVAPDYKRELVWNDPAISKEFPGLTCTGGDGTVFELSGIPASLNGWYAVCLFTDADGGMKASEGALIQVAGASAVTTTPAPTAPPAPTGTPVTPIPTLAPTEAPTVAPVQTLTPIAPTSTPGSNHEHNYTSSVTAPTCTAAGYTTYTCTSCGNSYTDSGTAALGHDWEEHSSRQVTGQEVHNICKDCGADFHGWSQSDVSAHVEAHLLSDDNALGGYYSSVVDVYDTVTSYTCRRCGATK